MRGLRCGLLEVAVTAAFAIVQNERVHMLAVRAEGGVEVHRVEVKKDASRGHETQTTEVELQEHRKGLLLSLAGLKHRMLLQVCDHG